MFGCGTTWKSSSAGILSPSVISTARDNGGLTASDIIRLYQPGMRLYQRLFLRFASGGAAHFVATCIMRLTRINQLVKRLLIAIFICILVV